MRLTDISIRQLPAPSSGQKTYFEGDGFGIRVSQGGSKTFVVMYGKERRLKALGRWPAVSLKDARKAAKAVTVAPPAKKRVTSYPGAVQEFLDDVEGSLRSSTHERYQYALHSVKADTLDTVPTTNLDSTQVKVLKAFFNWCVSNGLTDKNPFAKRRVVFNKRDRLLSDGEIVALLLYNHPPYSDIVKSLIITGQRRNQIWKYDASWFDGQNITFPASIMKSDRAHTIPMTRYQPFLKETSFNSWSKQKRRMDKETGVTGYCLHDFRRYFSTTMAKLGVPLHVTEQLLDHRTQLTGVAAIYNKYTYLPEMRQALRRYERHLVSIVQAARKRTA